MSGPRTLSGVAASLWRVDGSSHVRHDTFELMASGAQDDGQAAESTTSRRTFLHRAAVSAAGAASVGSFGAILGACAGGSDAVTDGAAVDGTLGPVLLRNGFPDGVNQGDTIIADAGTQRAIFALTQNSLPLPPDRLPEMITGTLTHESESRSVEMPVRSAQIPLHYLSLIFEPFGIGSYELTLDNPGDRFGDDTFLTTEFRVAPTEDVPLLHPGDPLPALQTPTEADSAGVTPICTRNEQCEFHRFTVAELLEQGSPIALMVSTPRFCTSGICGPTLEILINEAAKFPDVAVVHAEVYTDPNLLGSQPRQTLLSDTLDALNMTFEPSLIVAGADGRVRTRLDAAMDQIDIAAALATATA